jgi:protein gp37
MGERTKIAWATDTFNPWIGCTKVGPGCDHCYAELLDTNRFSHTLGGGTKDIPILHWGAGAPRYRTTPTNWKRPYKWNRWAEKFGEPRRVFCASLADVFDNEVPQEWRDDLWNLIEDTPHLTWLLLTKRIGRWFGSVPTDWVVVFPENVWMGATVVTQEEADRDVPKLLEVPADVLWLSVEPQLEKIVLRDDWLRDPGTRGGRQVNWVITGGESGTEARPYDVDWARSLRDDCHDAGVPIFVKQLGSHTVWSGCSSPHERWPSGTAKEDTGHGQWRVLLKDRAGADPSEWPEDLRVQEFPK